MLMLENVLSVMVSLIGICVSAWATLLACSLLLPSRTARAAEGIRSNPSKLAFRGGLAGAAIFAGAAVLLNQPAPGAKLLGWVLLLALLSLSAIGCTGLMLVMAERVRRNDPEMSMYASLLRGAALVVLPMSLPVFGWFLIAPATLSLGVGAGLRVLRSSEA